MKKRRSKTTTKATKRRSAPLIVPRDLSAGVIVVLSGGGFDAMNPSEVRQRMDQYIADVNADLYVQANTGGSGLRFNLLPNQQKPHLHQAKWRQICAALNLLDRQTSHPCRSFERRRRGGGPRALPAESGQVGGLALLVRFGADPRRHRRHQQDSVERETQLQLLTSSRLRPGCWRRSRSARATADRRTIRSTAFSTSGSTYNLPGALAHRNAFYELAGGDKVGSVYKRPRLLLDVTLAVLQGQTNFTVIHGAEPSLQQLATKSHVVIELETATFSKTLLPVTRGRVRPGSVAGVAPAFC